MHTIFTERGLARYMYCKKPLTHCVWLVFTRGLSVNWFQVKGSAPSHTAQNFYFEVARGSDHFNTNIETVTTDASNSNFTYF